MMIHQYNGLATSNYGECFGTNCMVGSFIRQAWIMELNVSETLVLMSFSLPTDLWRMLPYLWEWVPVCLPACLKCACVNACASEAAIELLVAGKSVWSCSRSSIVDVWSTCILMLISPGTTLNNLWWLWGRIASFISSQLQIMGYCAFWRGTHSFMWAFYLLVWSWYAVNVNLWSHSEIFTVPSTQILTV